MAVIQFSTGSFTDPLVSQAQGIIAAQEAANKPQPVSQPASSPLASPVVLIGIALGVGYWWYSRHKGYST